MRLLSTRELADALGVSESSLKRWVDSGKISASRTEGGHRRIQLSEAMRFIRDTRTPLARPELLDLPELSAARASGEDRLASFLRDGNTMGARGWLMARYLEGATIAELADGPIRDAMAGLGELWHHDEGGVFVEHRGTDVCLQAVAQIRSMIPKVATTAAIALGGGPAGDPYLLSTQLAAMVVTEAGMRAVNLGPDTPAGAFAHAVAEHQPKLVWISITAALAPARALSMSRWLDTLPATTTIVIGGQQSRALSKLPARAVRATSMADLAAVVSALLKRPRSS
ncbi:MAG: excisionase family DNA-binding protein [Deltaproteobacteria bacterium]|nr:excisionase family DNA-binding protein [Deltaproteobacteria bacterium]MDQ3299118.1 excisionase family DNA-binding protein [Myxococcota bacterium]